MGIRSYIKEVSPGVTKTFYDVTAEGVNKYTNRRVQKMKTGISSKVVAERIYKEYWSACRNEKTGITTIQSWNDLLLSYVEHIESKRRSPENPLGFSHRTVESKRSRLTHTKIWAEKHIELVTPDFVSRELDKMELNGMSRQNTNEVLKEVKCAFVHAISTGGINSNLFAGTKMRKVPKKKLPALNHTETADLLREAKNQNHPYFYVWLLSISLGLRRSELAGLKWSDIDLNQELIQVQRQKLPNEGIVSQLKNWEDRMVAIPKHIVPTLKEMKLKSRTEFVIELNCPKWERGDQAEVLREFCSKIGIKELAHHRLRATHITLALADDVPLAIVKENVGHAQLSTTDRYFSSSGIKMRGQMDRLQIQVPQDTEGVVVPLSSVK